MPAFPFDSMRRAVDELPRGFVDLARALRTAALWCAGPLDALALRSAGRRDLPPLWLRRHAGRVRDFEASNPAWLAVLQECPLPPRAVVLDAGCGPGALAALLRPRLPAEGRYVGFDVHGGCIRWCRAAYAGDARFSFELADVRSGFSAGGRGAVAEYRFPAQDASVHLVLAKSLFTHLLEPEARRYLRETARVLAPGGRAIVSAFLFEGEEADAAAVPAFPHPERSSKVRWRVRTRPEAAIAWSQRSFLAALAEAGLAVEKEWYGFFPGAAPHVAAQDLLLLRRADEATRSSP